MSRRLASFVVALFALQAAAMADERVNATQVHACLTRTGDAGACAGTLSAPCAHMVQTGLLRACLYRLRLRWAELLRREADALAATLPRGRADALATERAGWRTRTERECGQIGRNDSLKTPETASAERNRCRIGWIARRWIWVTRGAIDPAP